MRATTKHTLKPLCAALLLGLGLGLSPMASAVLAPNVADTYYFPGLGAQQPNYAQQQFLKVSPGSVALVKFDLSTLPANTQPEDVESAVVILAVQKGIVHGGIDAHMVLAPSQWNEVDGVGVVTSGQQVSRYLCKAEQGHEHFITMDVTEAVKFWLRYPDANKGIALVSSALHPNTDIEFDSREYNAFAPVLDVQLYPGEGFVGAKGDTGPMGPVGPMGPMGPTGAPGLAGEKGAPGPAGEKGATGPAGATGPVGPAGPQGVPGPIGATGPIGPQGLKGDVGAKGMQGPAGPIGPQGAKGDVGAQGPIGATGPAGPIGPQGVKGDAGARGPIGLTGPAGPIGPQGVKGDAGAQGPMGLTGPAGPIGLMGPAGRAGPMGPPGSITGGVYTRVVQYTNWERGNASVHCDAGDVAIGGGGRLNESNPKNMHTSAPIGSPRPTGWTVGYGSKASFWVYAICAK